jgi:uncharacterized membrane protein
MEFSECLNKKINPVNIRKLFLMLTIVFTFVWLVIIISPSFISYYYPGKTNITTFIYSAFSPLCHQLDNRTFHLFGYKFAVCSRCFFIYFGFFIGAILYTIFIGFNRVYIPHLIFLILPLFLIFFDFFLDLVNLYKNSTLSRSVTGFIAGISVSFFLIPGLLKFIEEIISYIYHKKIKNNE